MSLVTVLMSVYRDDETVEEAIRSILDQSFKEFEFLIVLDGASSKSRTVVESYQKKDGRIRVLEQENQGLTQALNRGLREARGSWIARQDADDRSRPERLENLLRMKEKNPHVALITSCWAIFSDGQNMRVPWVCRLRQWLPQNLFLRAHRYGNLLGHGTYFYDRAKVLEVGGYRSFFKSAQDYDLSLRLIEKFPVLISRDVLYELRLHAHSVSASRADEQFLFAQLAGLLSLERVMLSGLPPRDLEGQDPQTLKTELAAAFPWYMPRVEKLMRLRQRP